MGKLTNLHTANFVLPLTAQSNQVQFGTTSIRYQVTQVTDIRNLKAKRCYRIDCTQRVIIPNGTAFALTPGANNLFETYPALLSNQIQATAGTPALLDYSPRTINSAVMTALNVSDGTSNSQSRQHTSGSSTSQTNSYGGSVSLGFAGDVPTGGVSADYSHSSTREHNSSDTSSSDSGRSSEQGSSDSMSIKDWGAYASVDVNNSSPTWIWGQEYPWDVIQYRYCPTGNNVELPGFVTKLLIDESGSMPIALPPSQLSLFGLDFTMKAAWLVDLPADASGQSIAFTHTLQYQTATHGFDPKSSTPNVPLVQLFPTSGTVASPPALDLTLLGLDPITDATAGNGAVMGFAANKFVLPPDGGQTFKILSGANNLQVTGAGFNAPMYSDYSKGQPTLRIQFKIVDDLHQYSLFLKHWNGGTNGSILTMIINDDKDNSLIRHVDTTEGQGGDNNLLEISLRNKDYASIDYHDYLVFGLNTIDISIAPITPGEGWTYVLRALAIGEG